jgi:hypothetical protein
MGEWELEYLNVLCTIGRYSTCTFLRATNEAMKRVCPLCSVYLEQGRELSPRAGFPIRTEHVEAKNRLSRMIRTSKMANS